MDTIETNEVRFTMRMESDLYERIKEIAKKNKRSIAKEIEFQLEQNLDNELNPSELKFLFDRFADVLQDHNFELHQFYEQLEKIVEHFE